LCLQICGVPSTRSELQPAAQMPDLKTGQIHWDAKHDKLGPYDAEAFVDVHAQVLVASLPRAPVFIVIILL